MSPGDIYWLLENADGSGDRPCIVVSAKRFNDKYVVVVPVTTARFEERKNLPNCIPFHPGQYCFTKECVAQCEMISMVGRNEIPRGNPVAKLKSEDLRGLIIAIGNVFGASCELE